ncbi:MAG: amidohydrolase [Verrucomicrobia bacterium]|nr:amidohydrolase [Verrucomicrobiota bacterium]
MPDLSLPEKLIRWRRDFHRHPELGFCEYRTAARVAATLEALGWGVTAGREVMDPAVRMELPPAAEIAAARAEALRDDADPAWVARFEDGLTGVVGTLDSGRPGPVLAFRVDLDALPVVESDDGAAHAPAREGFASIHSGRMHACGHDGHTAIGLGLATVLPALAPKLRGKIKLIFQPAEEGCRGAGSMVAAGVLDDVDHYVATHLGISAQQTGLVACGVDGFLATTKLDGHFTGVAAHAGVAPHEGRNALLAAATATVQLHAIARHGAGASRVNVGLLSGGAARNIVADRATLKLEVRGATSAINAWMTVEAGRILRASAELHGVQVRVENMGSAGSAICDTALKAAVRRAAARVPGIAQVADTLPMGGSEDATLMMEAVQARGGEATYVLVGTPLPAGHHHPRFDIDEAALSLAVDLHATLAQELLGGTVDPGRLPPQKQ